MQLFKCKANDLTELSAFYARCGYGGTFDGSDDVFCVIDNDCLAGVARITLDQGVLILCGMQVLPTLRGKKIGQKLLNSMVDHIASIKVDCYCLPHNHLVRFYGGIGFVMAEPRVVPEFLIRRQLKYIEQGLNIMIMVRQ